MELMKEIVSKPWDTNMIRIPSHAALGADPDIFVEQAVTKFCPKAMSPTQNLQMEEMTDFMLVHEYGYPSDDCGEWKWNGYVQDITACANTARDDSYGGFSFGRDRRNGACYGEKVTVTETLWREWIGLRKDPPCQGGTWIWQDFYDTYWLNPTKVAEASALNG